jgi:hypothetical protein
MGDRLAKAACACNKGFSPEPLIRTASIVPMSIEWVATSTTCPRLQSNTATALASAGEPVTRTSHRPSLKRSSGGIGLANRFAIWRSPTLSKFTAKCPAALIAAHVPEALLILTSSVGGSADTEHTAVAVRPDRWSAAAVVMTHTPAARCRMPALNESRSAVTSPASEAEHAQSAEHRDQRCRFLVCTVIVSIHHET